MATLFAPWSSVQRKSVRIFQANAIAPTKPRLLLLHICSCEHRTKPYDAHLLLTKVNRMCVCPCVHALLDVRCVLRALRCKCVGTSCWRSVTAAGDSRCVLRRPPTCGPSCCSGRHCAHPARSAPRPAWSVSSSSGDASTSWSRRTRSRSDSSRASTVARTPMFLRLAPPIDACHLANVHKHHKRATTQLPPMSVSRSRTRTRTARTLALVDAGIVHDNQQTRTCANEWHHLLLYELLESNSIDTSYNKVCE